MKHQLLIQDYEVMVHIGTSVEEQKYFQPVRFSFEINYQQELLGASTDKLSDATDYVVLTDIIKKTATQKKFHLIEHLGHEVFKNLLLHLLSLRLKADLKLSAKKVQVPIENLKNGVTYSCSHVL
ncbi:MAG: dihydroneopterin aldolase [Pseudobdellovibrio sp.]